MSRALALDPDSAQVHSSAALIRNAEWDWTGAERELRRALQVNPGYAPTYQRLALTATVHGRFDEAQSLLRRAQTFDPLNWMVTYALGENAYYARRFDEAIVFAGQLDVKGGTANLLHRVVSEARPRPFPGSAGGRSHYLCRDRSDYADARP